MKKITLSLVMISLSFVVIAQTPQAFNYQAVARDNTGAILANQYVSFRIAIVRDSINGNSSYKETHFVTTNQYGLVTLEIGNGVDKIGLLEDIQWGTREFFLKIRMDETGGTNWQLMGASELLSVPYSLYSAKTGDTTRWRKNNDDLYYNMGNVGIGTSVPIANFDIRSSSTASVSKILLGNSNNSTNLFLSSGHETANPYISFKGMNGLRFLRYDNGLSELMRITSEGNVGIGTSDPQAGLHVDDTNGVLFTGEFGQGDIPVEGPGHRLMWYPAKGSFRVGWVNNTNWDRDSIGNFSVAMGNRTKAKGANSFAVGNSSKAGGISSIALGNNTNAKGNYSTSMGYFTSAIGIASVSMGRYTESTGDHSTATGFYTNAESFASVALGRYNVGGGNPTSWVETDPLFEIGIGSSSSDSDNAITILKNGYVGIGTHNPLTRLDVRGSSPEEGAVIMAANSDDSHKLVIYPGQESDPNPFIHWKEGDPLRFTTDEGGWSEKMRINGNGYVGIGTTEPQSLLHVFGTAMIGSISKHIHLRNNGSLLDIESIGAGLALNFQTGENTVMNVTSGYVGIGTSSPQEKLHVEDCIRVGEDLYYPEVYGEIKHAGGGNGFAINAHDGGGLLADICFQTNGTTRMLIESGGDIGIGTTTLVDGYKISVDGKIICEELRIELSDDWPDYVFDKEYALMPLKDLERNIRKNKHLPGVPSAKEVNENGIIVGDMTQILIQKVEELTLYIIEINNYTQSLNEKIERLEMENQRLKDYRFEQKKTGL